MSDYNDNIKKLYNSYMDKQGPSEEFLSSLTERLKQEQEQEQKSPAKNIDISHKQKRSRIIRIITAVAACVAICCALPFVLSQGKSDVDVSEEPKTPGALTSIVVTDKIEVPDMDLQMTAVSLAEKLESSLSELLESDKNYFVGEEAVSGEKLDELISKLKSDKAASKPEGKKLWYMAVFNDGSVIKFAVYENGAVTIKGINDDF